MAAEAEASREARAKVIAADGEKRASKALREASNVIDESPSALQLRYLQVKFSPLMPLNASLKRGREDWKMCARLRGHSVSAFLPLACQNVLLFIQPVSRFFFSFARSCMREALKTSLPQLLPLYRILFCEAMATTAQSKVVGSSSCGLYGFLYDIFPSSICLSQANCCHTIHKYCEAPSPCLVFWVDKRTGLVQSRGQNWGCRKM